MNWHVVRSRHSRMSLCASRVSATIAGACAHWRRDVLTHLDESGSQPVRRTRHSSKLSEFIGRELVSVCSRTALAQRHQFQLIHKFLLSQMKAAVRKCLNFNPCQCEIVLIPRSPLQRFLKVLTEQLRRWDGHHIQPPRNRPRGLR